MQEGGREGRKREQALRRLKKKKKRKAQGWNFTKEVIKETGSGAGEQKRRIRVTTFTSTSIRKNRTGFDFGHRCRRNRFQIRLEEMIKGCKITLVHNEQTVL